MKDTSVWVQPPVEVPFLVSSVLIRAMSSLARQTPLDT